MRLLALTPLAVAVSRAGGFGFLAAGTDVSGLKNELRRASEVLKSSPIPGASPDVLPIGVGFINWAIGLDSVAQAFSEHLPTAVWFFAPARNEDLLEWTIRIREMSKGRTKVWVQVGSVGDAVQVATLCRPETIVVQGADAGGHGLARGAGIISLLPEVADALQERGIDNIELIAAGGIMEGRGAAACLAIGAQGVVMGTRFLASQEANIAKGYQDHIIRATDGGATTVRTRLYDQLRGTTDWPDNYDGRSIINQSFLAAKDGMDIYENKRLYNEATTRGDEGWGERGRLTTYAGSGVGLVKKVMPAGDIVEEVRADAVKILSKFSGPFSKL
ncbi:MAG: hypothetical protein Q9163_003368 [Psora crenata]